MKKKDILKSIAATGVMLGGANMMQDCNVVYAAEQGSEEQTLADEMSELGQQEAMSETPSEYLEISSEEIRDTAEVNSAASESDSAVASETASLSDSTAASDAASCRTAN